ncbi:DUF4198 domain-containing protein [Neopusillimonas maritima]|uniref:ABC transporter permease n=1 Tax=Neopusillimonas maritima TaxID=2026239 RepID=A0ABX9MZ19_9BURK|nr:DUF4198 domain-containing protein [Neopusillimonas maritima]RII83299.1 ABC transporter permease [Neopusillimonas maritima]
MKKALALSLLTTALSLPAISAAHDFWLLPSSTVLSGNDSWVTFDGAVSNDKFHFNHRPLRLANLIITGPNGATLKPQNPHIGELRSSFDLKLPEAGTYRIAAVNDGVMALWKEDGENKRWFGTAAELTGKVPSEADDLRILQRGSRVEAFVTQGMPTPIEAPENGLGIRPLTHPNDLFMGEKAIFIVTLDGQPLSGVEVELVPGGQRYRNQVNEIITTTNENGEFEVTWPNAGQYWLHFEHRDNKTSVPQAQSRNLSYTATLEVLPE